MDRLCDELGYREAEAEAVDDNLRLDGALHETWVILSAEDERVVSAIRQRLAKVAAAVADAPLEGATQVAVSSALDGAELVSRGELAMGNEVHLPALMPSFVFLVTLPTAEQDKALELSRRTSQLIEGLQG